MSFFLADNARVGFLNTCISYCISLLVSCTILSAASLPALYSVSTFLNWRGRIFSADGLMKKSGDASHTPAAQYEAHTEFFLFYIGMAHSNTSIKCERVFCCFRWEAHTMVFSEIIYIPVVKKDFLHGMIGSVARRTLGRVTHGDE